MSGTPSTTRGIGAYFLFYSADHITTTTNEMINTPCIISFADSMSMCFIIQNIADKSMTYLKFFSNPSGGFPAGII